MALLPLWACWLFLMLLPCVLDPMRTMMVIRTHVKCLTKNKHDLLIGNGNLVYDIINYRLGYPVVFFQWGLGLLCQT